MFGVDRQSQEWIDLTIEDNITRCQHEPPAARPDPRAPKQKPKAKPKAKGVAKAKPAEPPVHWITPPPPARAADPWPPVPAEGS